MQDEIQVIQVARCKVQGSSQEFFKISSRLTIFKLSLIFLCFFIPYESLLELMVYFRLPVLRSASRREIQRINARYKLAYSKKF